MILYRKKYSEVNVIFLLLFVSIIKNFPRIDKLYYVVYAIAVISMYLNLYITCKGKSKIETINKGTFSLMMFLIGYITLNTILNFSHIDHTKILKMYLVIFIIAFLIPKISLYKQLYIKKFYENFTIVMNIITVVNLYEIITQKYLFLKYFNYDGVYAIDLMSNFRTMSVFKHPIVFGVFLVSLFLCNEFIIDDKKIKYILQINVIINLFFTQSRSSWLSFIFIIGLYYFKDIVIKLRYKRFELTYKKIYLTMFGLVAILLCFIIFKDSILNVLDKVAQRFITITDDSYQDMSRLQRLSTINLIVDYMTNNGVTNFLFGNGLTTVGKFMVNNPIYISNFTTTDNQYASFFYELGFIGLISYLTLIVSFIIKFFKNDNANKMNSLSILNFLAISMSIFFFEGVEWTDVFTLLIITMFFTCINDSKIKKHQEVIIDNGQLNKEIMQIN